MAGVLYTGVTNHNQISVYNTNTGSTGGGGQAGMVAAGTIRFNTTIGSYEAYDGYQWTLITNGKTETLQDIVQHAEDRIATTIELEYEGNVTIQDAYKAWEEANEKFKVILALAETK